ncbi:hypothetical protein COCVIDRAFT_91994 [Bipolaris victoriae FI3]|uniref:Ricin B lectin domain-containing protein n=2 Tax=Bipolaris TaxID=33194 RepID=W6YD18_COCC2|nr:uncharacterized protein COCCADRAFT_96088 [Bipolaris zeicola 26-R-13]XP_014559379.1 hypothetical protein COCVIDRAFT_91994 [Bipolaris victoriae FI3]EUC33404.1 hypothetical protein COCCADRAFT_96088 [Bipolaris zeicola 26-R-13]
MSDYTGPGIYTISPFHAPEMELDIWKGEKKEGTQVKLYKKVPNASNHQFQIVCAGGVGGNPEKGDREYFIIPVNSGLYMTAHVTTQLLPPKDSSIRWKLAHAGNGAYYINHVDGKKQLNVRGGAKEEGTELITYQMATAPNCQFILRAAA